MEYSKEELSQLQLCIKRDFELDPNTDLVYNNLAELKQKLKSIIQFLINKDFNRLLTIFYRLDLNEKVVTQILSTSNPDNIPQELVDLIIEREMKKVETRLKYRNL